MAQGNMQGLELLALDDSQSVVSGHQKRTWRIDQENAELLQKMSFEGRAASILFFASQGQEMILDDLAKRGAVRSAEDVVGSKIEVEDGRDLWGVKLSITVSVSYRDRRN
jgi:hypothetical protein